MGNPVVQVDTSIRAIYDGPPSMALSASLLSKTYAVTFKVGSGKATGPAPERGEILDDIDVQVTSLKKEGKLSETWLIEGTPKENSKIVGLKGAVGVKIIYSTITKEGTLQFVYN